MFKLNFRYDQNSARLNIEGLPDKSLGQSTNTIGILSSWQLELLGSPLLEGKLTHLESLMNVVFPYARYTLSGVKRSFGNSSNHVMISPSGTLHRICLFSSKEDTPPLEIQLDDAELSDLVRCLDDLRQDNRVQIKWNIPKDMPLQYRDIVEKIPLSQRFTAAIFGFSTFICVSLLYYYVPIPELIDKKITPTELMESKSSR